MHGGMDKPLDDIDDNSSDSLDSLEDDEFPSYFIEHGSPQWLFPSHGTYSLPVDSDKTKVCITSFHCWYSHGGIQLRINQTKNTPHIEAGSATYPTSNDLWKQLRCPHP